MPLFNDATEVLQQKIMDKRDKSFESLKEITRLKHDIKNLTNQKEKILEERDEHRAILKEQEQSTSSLFLNRKLGSNDLHSHIMEVKSLIIQIQKEKDKYICEISKQRKILKNQQTRIQTLVSIFCI